jgi:hypothetical protein
MLPGYPETASEDAEPFVAVPKRKINEIHISMTVVVTRRGCL